MVTTSGGTEVIAALKLSATSTIARNNRGPVSGVDTDGSRTDGSDIVRP